MKFKGRIASVKSWGKSNGQAFCTVWVVDEEECAWIYTGMFSRLPSEGDLLEGEYNVMRVGDPLRTKLQEPGPHGTEHIVVVTWDVGNPSLSAAYRGLADYLEYHDIMPQEIISQTLEREGTNWSVRLVVPNRAYR